jgi:geranylgeranyl pyrophosphate synthase
MVGGYLAGGSSEEVASLGKYGLDLGIAFQIVDDILDFTGDEKKTGKMVGNDLKEGNLTLPSLLAIKSSDDAKKAILAVISQEDPSVESVKECAKMVVKSGAIEKARGMGEYYGMEALGHLGCLSDTSYSKALRDVVAKVLERDS